MIESLHIKQFTAFSDASFVFGRGLNVFVGANGTGKSHLLKLLYALLAVGAQGQRDSKDDAPSEAYLRGAYARKLIGVFRPDTLGRLSRRALGTTRAQVELVMRDDALSLSLDFHTQSKGEVSLPRPPTTWLDKAPAFLPTRELLTLYPGFVPLYETTALPFEETWRDTCLLLGAPLARGPREARIRALIAPLEAALGGSIVLDAGGRFYLERAGVSTEVHLVAEGLRKLAMVARLVLTGALVDKGCLFWDEPEANLNPRLVRDVAATIVDLARGGIQVFVATHSLFLLRELYLRQPALEGDTMCFGLQARDEIGVEVKAGPTMDDIGRIAALDEELLQSDRYLQHEADLAGSA